MKPAATAVLIVVPAVLLAAAALLAYQSQTTSDSAVNGKAGPAAVGAGEARPGIPPADDDDDAQKATGPAPAAVGAGEAQPRTMTGISKQIQSKADFDPGKCAGKSGCVSQTITKIVDGDTVHTADHRIRLSLVNTPERGEPGFLQASAFTAQMCPVGSLVTVDQDDLQPYDRYGRLVANVFCGGKSLNAELLHNGHAEISTRYCGTSEFSGHPWAQKFGCGM